MPQLELVEHESYPCKLRFGNDQLRLLREARIDIEPPTAEEETYTLKPSSHIGALNLGDLAVVVRPKIPIDRVMFLIAYSMDPKNWRRNAIELTRYDNVLEAIALAFSHHTRQATRRGLLKGYRQTEDALNTVRGRVRFDEQIKRRFDIPLPLEVAFDEYTEDIEKNRLLKTAVYRLGHTFIRSKSARLEVRRLRPAFTTVTLGSYRRGLLPKVSYTRLDEHYRPAVELARLILDNSSLELFHGNVTGAAFLIDMNKVFERFLYVATGEALGINNYDWKQGAELILDESENDYENKIKMLPDLSWWNGSRILFVGDAKYKKLKQQGFEHADIYQMLAYCTAADLPSGLLVYAAGEDTPGKYKIKHTGKTIEVATLNLDGTPEEILEEVKGLAVLIKAHKRD